MQKETIAARFPKIIDLINNKLLEETLTAQDYLNAAAEDLILGGGKRLRPLLTVLSSRLLPAEKRVKSGDEIINIACAVELLHTATLVHDDIIDEAKFRRGRPATQERFGSKFAVFTGDFLLSIAMKQFTKYISRISLLRLNNIVRQICIGEINQFSNSYSKEINLVDYIRHIRRKTALLFSYSTYVGARENGLRGTVLSHVYNFGLEMGMAFQIRDDILDYTGNSEEIGKETGNDLNSGIYTLPVINLLQEAPQKTGQLLQKENTVEIMKMIKKYNILDKCRELEEKFLNRAEAHLQNLPRTKNRENLKFLLSRQLARKK